MTYLSSGGLRVAVDQRFYHWTSALDDTPDVIWDSCVDPIEVWENQPAVRTVVGFLARHIAHVPMHPFQMDGSDRERVRTGLLAESLDGSLDPDGPTQFERHYALVVDLCMWERHASFITEASGLRRLAPETWKFQRDVNHRPVGIRVNGGRVRPLSDFLWFDGYPGEHSPMTALAVAIEEERATSKNRIDMLNRGGLFPGWVKRPLEAKEWSEGKRDAFRTAFNQWNAGGSRAGSSPVLEDGMEYHETSGITPENAQQLESRKFTRAEVAAFFHVPPPFIGLLDNANYSNVTAFRELLYADVLGSHFQQIEQAYNQRYVRRAHFDGQFVEFNVGEKLRMSHMDRVKSMQAAVGGPWWLRNEARKLDNLPEIDGGDELIVPLNVIEGGQASPLDSGTQNEE